MIKNLRLLATIFLISFLLPNCKSGDVSPSSSTAEPTWVHEPTRVVENGYIIYVGTGEDHTPERAHFKAEASAIQDLANECSFAPKGTRVEDSFSKNEGALNTTYAKVAVSFSDCDDAKKAVDPSAIKSLANAPMTEMLKKYQEMIDEPTPEDLVAANGESPPGENQDNSESTYHSSEHFYIHDDASYFIVRQQVAYYKQTVVLAPPTAYQPGSPETVAFVQQVQPAVIKTHNYEVQNPAFKNSPQTWSSARSSMPQLRSLRGTPPGSRAMHSQGNRRSENLSRSHPHGGGHNGKGKNPRGHRRKGRRDDEQAL